MDSESAELVSAPVPPEPPKEFALVLTHEALDGLQEMVERAHASPAMTALTIQLSELRRRNR